jgi:hypothetical protein
LNVSEYVAPEFKVPLSNDPLSAVTVCGIAPEFVHVTVVPTGIERAAGEKELSWIITLLVVVEVLVSAAFTARGFASAITKYANTANAAISA